MKKTGLLIVALCVAANIAYATDATDVAVSPAKPAETTGNATVYTHIAPVDIEKLKTGETTLNVGHYTHLPPFYYAEGNFQPGFGYDIFMEVAKKAGIKNVNFIGYDNATDLNEQLRQGKIDVIANAWDLPGTRKQFLLTEPYYTKGGLSFLYFKQKGSFQTADDLKDHRVGTFKQGYADRYWLPAHNVSRNSIKTFTTLKDLMFALKDGGVDVAVIYYPLAQLAQQQLTDQLTATLVQPINDVYAIRKQDIALQNALGEAIKALSTEGALDKIQAQYFNILSSN
jgi:ABC-type amino acid transport substrate-binding protein